jgi:hypothetical protein
MPLDESSDGERPLSLFIVDGEVGSVVVSDMVNLERGFFVCFLSYKTITAGIG